MVTFPIVERGDLERVALQALKTLDAIVPGDLPRVGGKAFNCARLKQAGFPVPDGLAIASDATDDEIRRLATDPWLDSAPPGTRVSSGATARTRGAHRRARATDGAGRHVGRGVHDQPRHRRRRARDQRRT